MKKIKLTLCVMVLSIMWSITLQAAPIYISVASSMTDAVNEIITLFSQSHPDVKILPNFAASGSLAKQIVQGAPADLYVSANPKWMKYLLENKMIEHSSERTFVFNQLVFLGKPEKSVSRIEQITSLERIGIGAPQSVPVGHYARQAMEGIGIYGELRKERKLVMAKDARQALMYTDRGEVDGAFVYKTDAMLAKNAKILFIVPDELYSRVSYPLALTVDGSKNADAVLFFEFMESSEVAGILIRNGFEVVK